MAIKITANDYRTGTLAEIEIDQDVIRSVRRVSETADAAYPWISPGWIDIHVNGFAGFDLNSPSVTKETVVRMAAALAVHGVTLSVPTLITASNEQMSHSLEVIRQACEEDPVTARSFAGIHLEGPYLSPEQGFRGAHPAHEMRKPDWREFMDWQRLSGNRIVKVTLAPELEGASAFIRQLKKHGIIAAMGHSNASSAQIREAVDAGLSMCTHLGNGIHYLLNRHAPCLWDLLETRELFAGFIADGHHLPPSVVKTIVRMKGNKAILVSDAVHLAGLAPGIYETHIGGRVELLPNGRLQLADNPNVLAGSAMSMLDGIRFLLGLYPGGLKKVIDMATAHPAALLKLKNRGRLQAGGPADFILFHYNRLTHEIALKEVWRQGSPVKPSKES